MKEKFTTIDLFAVLRELRERYIRGTELLEENLFLP